jgi:hypothetical protein
VIKGRAVGAAKVLYIFVKSEDFSPILDHMFSFCVGIIFEHNIESFISVTGVFSDDLDNRCNDFIIANNLDLRCEKALRFEHILLHLYHQILGPAKTRFSRR